MYFAILRSSNLTAVIMGTEAAQRPAMKTFLIMVTDGSKKRITVEVGAKILRENWWFEVKMRMNSWAIRKFLGNSKMTQI